MELHAHGLDLRVTPNFKGHQGDFARIAVEADAPGFSGRFDAWVERNDFMRFATGLESLDVNLRAGDTAVLDTIEGDFSLVLTMQSGGHIGGVYRFQGGWFDQTQPTVLSGAFTMDQSYLPELRKQVAALLATTATGTSLQRALQPDAPELAHNGNGSPCR